MAAVLLLVAFTAGSAEAQPAHPGYLAAGSFGHEESGEPGELVRPSGIAVDETTGDIFVSDTGHGRVAVYRPAGASAEYVGEFGAGVLEAPHGIAFDQNDGSIYVSDPAKKRVFRFLSDGPLPTSYSLDTGYAGPPAGTGPGQVGSFSASIAIDETSDDLLIADTANRRISRYSTATGAFLSSFDGTAGGGPKFAVPQSIAVAPGGDIYVVDATGDPYNSGLSTLRHFNSAGSSLGTQRELPLPSAVAVDKSTGMVIAGGAGIFGSPPELFGFIDEEAAGSASLLEPQSVLDLAVDPQVPQRIYAVTGTQDGAFGPTGVQVFDSTVLPGVSVRSPTPIGTTTAQLHGMVDPGGFQTTAKFEYSSDGKDWKSLADLPAMSGSGEQAVEDELTGIAINSSYQVRLTATNQNGESTSSPVTFATRSTAPEVLTGGVTDLDADSVQVTGQVNPLGQQTTYHFDYGTTTSYGSRTPAFEDIAGDGRVLRVVTEQIDGLDPATTYHYRLVATNQTGTTLGGDSTFTTSAAEPEQRGYELVTPPDKGQATLNLNGLFQANPDGNGLVYQGPGTIDSPGTNSAPVSSRFLSTRTDAGWQFMPLDPPQLGGTTQSLYLSGTLAVSEDMSQALVISNAKLAEGAVEGNGNLYLRNTKTGEYQFVASGPRSFYNETAGLGLKVFYGGSSDFSTVVFASQYSLTADAPQTGIKLYRWSAGNLSVVSLLPDGEPSSDGVGLDNVGPTVRRYVSVDGTRIYYQIAEGPEAGVYLFEPGKAPLPISRSHRQGDPTTVQNGKLLNVSRNGRYAFFEGFGGPLTEDGAGSGSDIYRYDADTGDLQFVAPNLGSDYAASANGSAILYSDGFGGPTRLWRNGSVESVPGPSLLSKAGAFDFSPSGRYVAITTFEPLTADDNLNPAACPDDPAGFYGGRCWEIYRFDSETEETVCVSCARDGSPPAGPVNLVVNSLELSGYQPHFMTDAGSVYFDTPTKLVAQDTNGTRDVYEYSEGADHLISPGTESVAARFVDIGREGKDVFFITAQRLVGIDIDSDADQYDARVGGGLPGQRASSPAQPPCVGEACQGQPAISPAGPNIATSAFGNQGGAASRPLLKLSAPRVAIGKAASIHVGVPGAGSISISGSSIERRSRYVPGPGTYTIRVSLNGRSQRRLARSARLTIPVRVFFRAKDGSTKAAVVKVKFMAKGDKANGSQG